MDDLAKQIAELNRNIEKLIGLLGEGNGGIRPMPYPVPYPVPQPYRPPQLPGYPWSEPYITWSGFGIGTAIIGDGNAHTLG